MASATDDSNEHHGPHPPLPPVHDEAADTPMWVPILGIALFLLMAFFMALRGAGGDAAGDEAAGDEAAGAEAAAEAADEAPADEAPAE